MRIQHLAAAAALVCAGAAAHASQFFVFPVKEIDGVSKNIKPEHRPLIDQRVRDLLPPEVQLNLVGTFAKQLAQAYPASVVHAAQVRDTVRGAYQYVDNDSLACGEGFTAPVRRSYAAVLGITRASWYEVPREGGRVEVLVPVTLNLQLVKPDAAKVVYAISETVYTPFVFTRAEMNTPAMQAKVRDVLAGTLQQQVQGLVEQLKTGFNPKESSVRIVGRSERTLVVDQGFEVGFKAGDEPLAQNRKTGREALFKVLSVDSGYAVLRVLEGDAGPGDEFTFVFEAQADDSRKPRVLPVTSEVRDKAWTNAVADLFTKEVGFKAGFQVASVDANFQDTMVAISRQAACVPWDKYPASKTVMDSRDDHPDYLMRFELSRSPVAQQSGLGNVNTVESFMTTITAQVVDVRGNVLFSEMGHDAYKLEKTAGQGLSLANAQEVSLKNATLALAKRFVENVRFEPGEFKISRADKSAFVVSGLNLPEGGPAPAFEVLRPLGVKVNGKPTFWRLALGDANQAPAAVDGGTQLAYSKLDDEPRAGDLVRVRNMPRAGQVRMAQCKEPYRAPGSLPADFVLPMVEHAAYRSSRFQVLLNDEQFTSDTNRLLQSGFFKLRVATPQATEVCLRPGYSVKLESAKCDGGTCSAQILAATTVILEKGGERVGNHVQAEKVSFEGFSEPQQGNFANLKAYESVYKNVQKLSAKLDSSK